MLRRTFIKQGAAGAGTLAAAGAGFSGPAMANRHPHPHDHSLDFLDRETYTRDMTVHTAFEPGVKHSDGVQMMALGERRFLFTDRSVIEITNPLAPVVIGKDVYQGARPSVAFNAKIGKWIMVTTQLAPSASASAAKPGGKYAYPEKIEAIVSAPGLRGCRIYDVSDPANIRLLSMWSTDQGDPERALQTGEGAARNYYDGGKYAYLDAGPDNSFTRMESPYRHYTRCLQIIDLEDPAAPKFVSNWWLPGQRDGEEEAYGKWREHGDHTSWTSCNGKFYVPRRVEDGGKYAYSTWGAFGFMVHDVSDPAHPKLVSRYRADYNPGSIDYYSCNVAWLDRGFVIAANETLEPDCFTPFRDPVVLDMTDPANPAVMASIPRPTPPAGAPYDDFCNKRGRYGTRKMPHLKAPGKVHPNFLAMTYFGGGLQCFDLSDPRQPKNVAYFIPPQAGELDKWNSFNRSVESVFIEWDRKLIWAGSDSGLYLLSSPHLGEPVLGAMAVREWTLPGLNAAPA